MEREEVLKRINPILDEIIPETFVTRHIEETSTEELRKEVFGVVLSKWTGWDVDEILNIAVEALEDCNARNEAEKVREILEALRGEELTMGCDQCNAAMINGVFCHETGCPNRNKEWSEDENAWVWPAIDEELKNE